MNTLTIMEINNSPAYQLYNKECTIQMNGPTKANEMRDNNKNNKIRKVK